MHIDILNLSKTPVNSAAPILSIPEAHFAGNGLNLVFGPSGSGKTTLLRLLAGIDQPTTGSVTIGGTCINSLTAEEMVEFRRRHIGYVFQDTNLIPELTAWENIALPLTVGKNSTLEKLRQQACTALENVGLAGFAERFPQELSGGEQQRVGIARAICGNREVILADEPTGALDSKNSESIFQLLATLAQQDRLVILVSHDVKAQQFAAAQYEITDGKMQQR